jgi:hypothetical protein
MFKKGNTVTLGRKLNLSDEERKRRANHVKSNINAKGLNVENGNYCKFYEVDGLRIQGRWELAYILNLKALGLPLPTKSKIILTPTGAYTPDFEFDDYFVEVKSAYTIRTCRTNGQFEKIKWVSNNIKKVRIVLITERRVGEILFRQRYAKYQRSLRNPYQI